MPREVCLPGQPLLVWGLFAVNLAIAAGALGVPILMRAIHRAVGENFPEVGTWKLMKTIFGIGAAYHAFVALGIFWDVAAFELLSAVFVALAILACLAALLLRRAAIVSAFRAYLSLLDRLSHA